MAYWEFLLQKEGDRDWLPLETAHVEISEGRYRIIAHTSYRQTTVEIRLSQLLSDQTPPRHQTRRRFGATTENGLMVVIPFTHLTPGHWTVSCRGVDADATGQRWQYGVQLQVLAIESGLDYWDTDLDSPAWTGELEGASIAELGVADPPAAEPGEPPTAVMPSTGTTVVSALSADLMAAATPHLPDAATLDDLPLRLPLQHQALVAQAQSTVTLRGQLTSFSQLQGLPTTATLWLQLRDPETAAVLHREGRTLTIPVLPSHFELTITLPPLQAARLLVGELSLWSVTQPPQVLAIQGFTITLNLDSLLEQVANQGEQTAETAFAEPSIESVPAAAETAEVASSTTGDPPEPRLFLPRTIPFRQIYLPATGLTLPPVIYRPLDRKTVGEPSLPPVSPQRSRSTAGASSATTGAHRSVSLPQFGQSAAATEPSSEPSDRDRQATSVDLPSVSPRSRSPQLDAGPARPPAVPPATPPPRPDFQSRFWSRLSALAQAAQQAAADTQAAMAAAEVETQASPPTTETSPTETADAAAATRHEVVIYETDPDAAPEAVVSPDSSPEPAVEPPTEAAEWEAVPTPHLHLPPGELVAGSPLAITVQLPQYPRRLAVKVWMTDIQSRSLADRPRWLMQWTPTDTGDQTAILQLQVPLGCMEVQIEAIAVDLATQHESYKTTLVRSIVPPNLPDIALSDPL